MIGNACMHWNENGLLCPLLGAEIWRVFLWNYGAHFLGVKTAVVSAFFCEMRGKNGYGIVFIDSGAKSVFGPKIGDFSRVK